MSCDKENILKRYYNGEKQLRNVLIEAYIPLVKLVCGRLCIYTTNLLDADDLYSYGIFGLIDSIDKYSPDKNIKFETYAFLRIKGAILNEIRKMDMVPRAVRNKEKEIKKLEQIGISDEKAIAEYLKIDESELRKIRSDLAMWNYVWIDSVDETIDEQDSLSYISLSKIGNPEEIITKIGMEEFKKLLVDALNKLSHKQKLAVTLYYYEKLTQKEIADILEISPSRTGQLIKEGVINLKQTLGPYSYLFDLEAV